MTLSKRPEILVPLSFMMVSILWILYSDFFFLHFQKNISPGEITRIQSIKGCAYILVVTAGMYLLLRYLMAKLYATRQQYKDLFYTAANPFIIFDRQTHKIINVNQSAVNAYNYTFEQFKQLSIQDLKSDPAEGDLNEENTKKNIFFHRKKNGEQMLCMEMHSEILYSKKPCILLSVKDVTEIESAKTELAEREKQMQLILNSITDGFFILSNEMIVERANGRLKDLVEVPANKIEGRHLNDLFPSTINSYSYAQYLYAIETKTAIHFEHLYKNAVWHRISAYPYNHGLTVFFRDITEEKQKEIKTFENEQNLLALINNTEDLIWSVDKHFTYHTFNEPYKKVYKEIFNEELWIGKTALNAAQGETHVNKWTDLYRRALNGDKFSTDLNFVIGDTCKSATARFNPIYSTDKSIIGVGCFLQNITERKLNEKRIEQQNEQLRKIAFITSHKVRVPLTNILGLIEVLDSKEALSETNCEIIELIKTSAQLLDTTIKSMVEQTVNVKM